MEKIYSMILEDQLSWEYLIVDVIREEGIDPWDVNISKLSKGYLKRIREMKELNFRLSGKVLLIAAILLKMKSEQFAFVQKEEREGEEARTRLIDEVVIDYDKLDMNVPLPKKRKVTLQELMSALESAMIVKQRKEAKRKRFKELKKRQEFLLKIREVNISDKITSMFSRLKKAFAEMNIKKIFFSKLIPSRSREDVVWTLLPLLHLSHDNKVRMTQEKVFDDISVELVEE